MKKIKVAQIGCGKMSKYTMRYVYEKDGEIACAFDINPDRIGKDISYIMGGEPKNVAISNVSDLESVLKKTKPDVAITFSAEIDFLPATVRSPPLVAALAVKEPYFRCTSTLAGVALAVESSCFAF